MSHKIYLALGSNVGNSKANIEMAIKLLGEQVAHTTSAKIYTSKAVGYTDQPDFLNTVLSGDTELTPQELLAFIKQVEKKVGRIERFRWGPREVDIDIIFYDSEVINSPGLHIPHPRFAERDFVLKPLCDLNADFVDPLSKKKVSELYDQLDTDKLSIQE